MDHDQSRSGQQQEMRWDAMFKCCFKQVELDLVCELHVVLFS